MYLRNSPALAMIWSLIPQEDQRPNNFSPICHENLLEKGPSILYEGHYAPALLKKSCGGIRSLNICKDVQTKAC